MQQVTDGVYRIGSRWVNLYLVEDGGAVTFVDTGFPGYAPMARDGLSDLGYAASDVKAIVLTHTHSDHIGGARELASETGAPVFVHENEAGIATGTGRPVAPTSFLLALWRPTMLRFVRHAISNGGIGQPTVTDVTTYSDGEVLDVPGKPRLVFCPGHSKGHCAVLLEQQRVLFCGDALAMLATHTGQTGPMLHPFNEDGDKARESLSVLDGLEADIVLPGHGEPFRDSPQKAVLVAASR